MPKNTLDIAIIDYQMSNLFSVQAACRKVGLKSEITRDTNVILESKAAMLPGVGAFGEAMNHLVELKLDKCIKDFISTGKPFIGICLGMQLLFSESEEFGHQKGLGIVEGQVKKFDFENKSNDKYPVPQIGWNKIMRNSIEWKDSFLKQNKDGDFMYFVHSYYVTPSDSTFSIAVTDYGDFSFCSALSHENIFAAQFHPEKSGQKGLKLYDEIKQQINKD